MEVKKSPKASLQNKRGLLLQIGMIVAIGAMIAAFSYSQRERVIVNVAPESVYVAAEQLPPSIPDEPGSAPVQKIAISFDGFKIVDNTTKITDVWDPTVFEEGGVYIPQVTRSEKPVDDAVFLVAEFMPAFEGGDEGMFRAWVMKQIKYPAVAADNGIQGKVVVSFVIEKDGSLTNIEILQSPDRSLSEETIRVLGLSPKWTPGKQRTMPVRVKFNIPVEFRLQ